MLTIDKNTTPKKYPRCRADHMLKKSCSAVHTIRMSQPQKRPLVSKRPEWRQFRINYPHVCENNTLFVVPYGSPSMAQAHTFTIGMIDTEHAIKAEIRKSLRLSHRPHEIRVTKKNTFMFRCPFGCLANKGNLRVQYKKLQLIKAWLCFACFAAA